jgi:chorismate mutase
LVPETGNRRQSLSGQIGSTGYPKCEANGLAFLFRQELKIMSLRGVRGAVVVEEDTPEAILGATRGLLENILAENRSLQAEDVAAAFFTMTEDLRAAYPAQAARQMGWSSVPLMCSQEIPVPGGLERCIRLLVLWNTELPQQGIHSVYLGEAARLRPDLDPQVAEKDR